jgi:N-hydroxyarylamine O-acetyltransferase
MLLIVEAEGREWLADVGFGATLLEPIPFEDGAVSRQGGWTYGLAKQDNGLWRLRSLDAGGWIDLYSVTQEPQSFIDYVVYNHYTATHPDSPFVAQPRAVMVKPDVRYTLGGNTFISKYPDGSSEKRDLSEVEAIQALRNTFGIVLSPRYELRLRDILAEEIRDEAGRT